MTDAQLLDWYLSRRDEAAEAAFEELVFRHGPMVIRLCRGVLRDAHDAEDAFQAVFLILANRAGSIRRSGSIASWLFGVANRVASRARARAARRRRVEQCAAERMAEGHSPAEIDPDWEVLHEEIDGLPEGLRDPVVLCHLEGMSYGAAARRLAISEATVRGRLVRARERLRQRLTRRGLGMPAGLLVAGSPGHLQAVVPASLVHSTVRIALGFMAGDPASSLARAVLKSMLLKQLRLITLLVLLGAGSGYWLWHASAMGGGDQGNPRARQAAPRGASEPPVAAAMRPRHDPTLRYRFSGSVRVEETGQPVAGVKVRIDPTDFDPPLRAEPKEIETDATGRFALDLPAGHLRYLVSGLPRGYWVPRGQPFVEMLALGSELPSIRRDCLVREGTDWTFHITRGADRKPVPGYITGYQSPEVFMARADGRGQMHLTLPPEGRKVTLSIWESFGLELSPALSRASTGPLLANVEWETNFRPDELREISRMEGEGRRFRLVDADGKTATIQVPAAVEPVNHDGRLVILVTLSDRRPEDYGELEGQVLDEEGHAIGGAQVALVTSWGDGGWGSGERVSNELRHRTATDRQGGFRLPDVPRWTIDDRPLRVRVVVIKDGYVGRETPMLTLAPGEPRKTRVLDPIRLERGVSLSGVVVDHRGWPVAGAWARFNQRSPHGGVSGTTTSSPTDAEGRFVLRDLRRGLGHLTVFYGGILKGNSYLVDGSPIEARIQLPERPREPHREARDAPALEPLAVGHQAPEWEIGAWSDGRPCRLADVRGRVVVLYLWSTGTWQSVSALTALGKLAAAYESRDVTFLAIHCRDKDEGYLQDLSRRLFAFKNVKIQSAVDRSDVDPFLHGATAQRYGIRVYPTVIVIDREGRVAFRSDSAIGDRNLAAVFNRMAAEPAIMTEEKADRLIEDGLAREIEEVLRKND
jgi:RNA polymerase sigma factor (sigma-70 family)